MRRAKKILYAGDSPVGGPANYLLAILRHLHCDTVHVPPSQPLYLKAVKDSYHAFILSDFSRKKMPARSERMIERQVQDGAGLLMVGGWGSFSGLHGFWQGSRIENLLPVTCLGRDDRINFPGGARIEKKEEHEILAKLSFHPAPSICGLNRVRLKERGRVLVSARKILDGRKPRSLFLDRKEYPILVIDRDSKKRIAALAADLAPHWCGGLVDWGIGSSRLPVARKIYIELGKSYIAFVSSLIRWLCQNRERYDGR